MTSRAGPGSWNPGEGPGTLRDPAYRYSIPTPFRMPGRALGIAPGAREGPHVNNALYIVGLKDAGECLHGMGGMADGEQKRGSIGTHYP